MGRAANPVDATLGGPDDLLEGVASEIGNSPPLPLRLPHSASVGLSSGHRRAAAPPPAMALAGDERPHLVAGMGRQPSHSSRVAFCPPRKRRGSPSTPIRLSVL